MEVQTETSTSASTGDVGASTEASSTPARSEAPSTQSVASAMQSSGAQAQSAHVVAEKPSYTPNYKFKVMDREMEIPEKWRAIVKDADTEKEARELFEKAYGLDEVKKSRDSVREEYKTYKSNTEPNVRMLTQAAQLYSQGKEALEGGNARAGVFKLTEAFKVLGVPKQVLQRYILEDLKLDELPPEQKASYNRAHELEQQNQMFQQQLEQMKSETQNFRVQQRTAELNQVISRPDISPIVQAFDQRNGQGSFYNEVVLRGNMYFSTYQKDPSAEQVVSEIIKQYGLQAPAPAAPTQPQVAQNGSVPVIPAVKGGTQSPVGKNFKSIEDIKKYAQEKYG